MSEHLNLESPAKPVDVVDDVGDVSLTAVILGEVPEDLYDAGELELYISEQIGKSIAERSTLMDNIVRWQNAYQAPHATAPKNFPLRNSSNITVPVIKESVGILFSSLAQTILTPNPRWIFKDLAEEWTPFKSIIERFMDLSSRREFNLDKIMQTCILEATKMGTSVYEVGHEHITRTVYTYSEDGTEVEKTTGIVKSGPQVWNIPLEDWFIRFHEASIQDAGWVAKRLRYTNLGLKQRVVSGLFGLEIVERMIAGGPDSTVSSPQANREELSGTKPGFREDHEVFEVWINWNLSDGDDNETLLRVYFNYKLRKIMGVKFSPYHHGKKPFGALIYFPVEHQFYGEGVCSQLEDLQAEISTIHNQRIDNATIANLRMILHRRGARALKPGDALYAGKIVDVTEMSDVQPFQLGEVYPSTVSNEVITRQIAERLSGTSEANSRGTPVTRTTAGAQMALLQEQAKRLDQTIRSTREALGFIGELVLSMYFQFGAGDKPDRWLGEKGIIVSGLFKLPKRASELGIGLEATAPTSASNKEIRQQSQLALFNLLNSMYEKFAQLTQLVVPEALPEVVGAMVVAAKQFMFQTLESFDVTNPEEILAGLSVLERVLPTPEDFGGMAAAQRSAEQAEVFDQLLRLENILLETPTDGSGRDRLPEVRPELREVPGAQGVLDGNGTGIGVSPAPPGTPPGGGF